MSGGIVFTFVTHVSVDPLTFRPKICLKFFNLYAILYDNCIPLLFPQVEKSFESRDGDTAAVSVCHCD